MTHTHPDGQGAAASNLHDRVTGHDRRTLDAIFRHPLAHNLELRDVVTLMAAIGRAEEKSNGELSFEVGGERLVMAKPHGKDLSSSSVQDLRHLLTKTGWSPDADAPTPPAAETVGLIVVIDHAGATLYRAEGGRGDGGTAHDQDRQHPLQHLARDMRPERHDADRDEKEPDDDRYFESVAAALAPAGRIVVIGHGKGQSNEADHLSAYLLSHHKGLHDRIVREIVADLPHMTKAELIGLGRHALA